MFVLFVCLFYRISPYYDRRLRLLSFSIQCFSRSRPADLTFTFASLRLLIIQISPVPLPPLLGSRFSFDCVSNDEINYEKNNYNDT